MHVINIYSDSSKSSSVIAISHTKTMLSISLTVSADSESAIISSISVTNYSFPSTSSITVDEGGETKGVGNSVTIASVMTILVICVIASVVILILSIFLIRRRQTRKQNAHQDSSVTVNGIKVQKNMCYMPTVYGDEMVPHDQE